MCGKAQLVACLFLTSSSKNKLVFNLSIYSCPYNMLDFVNIAAAVFQLVMKSVGLCGSFHNLML